MKFFFNGNIPSGTLFTYLLLWVCMSGKAQQSQNLYFMHSLPEANFVNPAVQGRCGLFVGLPVISSSHMNFGNSGFTAGDAITLYTDNTIRRKGDLNTDRIRGLNYYTGEVHTTLLALGHQRNDLYFTFTAMEKNHTMALYTGDLVAFSLRGDQEFEGRSLQLKGTNGSLNHFREYALGISKRFNDRLTLGAKAKLLFGKYDFSTGNSAFGIYVDENSDNIILNIDGNFNGSVPYSLRMENPDIYRTYRLDNNSFTQQLLNRKNPGFAFDFGFIYRYSDRTTFSGSLLDLGMIFYRSNLTNYSVSGSYSYFGPFGTGAVDGNDLWNAFDALNQNLDEEVTNNAYIRTLDPKLYLGASYQLNDVFNLNLLLYNRLLPGKLVTGAGVSVIARPAEKLEASISWSYINRSFTNVGFGLAYGNEPIQAFVITDNIVGFVLPFEVKTVNLRFGINLFFGCKGRFNLDDCGCEWMRDAEDHRIRMEKARRNGKARRN